MSATPTDTMPVGYTAAVIVAAGSSIRMGGVQKQLLKVNGVPVLIRTLQSFEACREISEIVVVAKEEDISAIRELSAAYRIQKLTAIIAGGKTRAISAQYGFQHVSARAQYVAIHDGARCLVTPEEIKQVCYAAYQCKAASAAMPVTDTVKRVTKQGFVAETLDRDTIFLAATPQVFSVELYRAALSNGNDISAFTDDNQLVEALSHPVRVVQCSKENIKITYPEDISYAEFILNRREGLR